jgi:hypothetical protein
VADERRLAVHDLGRPHDVAAVHLADALVPEAHAQHRPATREPRDHRVGQPGVLGAARARRDEHGIGVERLDLIDGQLVGSVDEWVGAQLAQILHEVVDEAVVVVDDQDPGRHGRRG